MRLGEIFALLAARGHFAAGEESALANRARAASAAVYRSLGRQPGQLLGNPLDFYQQTTYSLITALLLTAAAREASEASAG